MELALSLGKTPKPFTFIDKTQRMGDNEIGFCMELGSPLGNEGIPEMMRTEDVKMKRKRSVLDNRSTDEVDMTIRASDEEQNGSTSRKKLRLTKDKFSFLEESFKEHQTLYPKQKLALARQLNVQPRQVEVWFQNRRAREKLKQREIDCEYLKRCCEKLTEENRRLQKELQESRALKASQSFNTQLPATTLTMCSSCERDASITNSSTSNTSAVSAATTAFISTVELLNQECFHFHKDKSTPI